MIEKTINGIRYIELLGVQKSNIISIFLPGLGAFKENYIEHLIIFNEYYEKIYILDLPEQGSKGKWSTGSMVDNLKEFLNFIDSPKVKEIHLLGHSAGANAILSFLCNYNSVVENYIFSLKKVESLKLNKLVELGFFNQTKDYSKISKLILYAPIDDFKVVFPKKWSAFLKIKNKKYVYNLLNYTINYPTKFLGIFYKNNFFSFEINKNKTQYFNLIINNHSRFFNYVSKHITIFELLKLLDFKFENHFSNKNILIQFGSNDWLLKPFFKRGDKVLSLFYISKTTKIIKHSRLGHLLNKKNQLDINLNRQMIVNKNVINSTRTFIHGN